MPKIHGSLLLPGVLASLLVACSPVATKPSPGGWITLIDAKGGEQGWVPWGDANWHRSDGVLTADHGDGVLLSPKDYANLDLRVEFWTERDTNSGIFIRCTDPQKITAVNAYEVNIFDKRPDPSFGTGAIVGVAQVSPMPHAGGRWNTFEIIARGPVFTVALNGVRTVDAVRDARLPTGRIALQYGGCVVKFRRVEITES